MHKMPIGLSAGQTTAAIGTGALVGLVAGAVVAGPPGTAFGALVAAPVGAVIGRAARLILSSIVGKQ